MTVGRDAHPAEDDFEHGLQDMHGAGDPGMGLVGERYRKCAANQRSSPWPAFEVLPAHRTVLHPALLSPA